MAKSKGEQVIVASKQNLKKSISEPSASHATPTTKHDGRQRRSRAKPSVKNAAISKPEIVDIPAIRLFQIGDEKTKRAADIEIYKPELELAQGALPMFEATRRLLAEQGNLSANLWGLLPFDFENRTGMSASAFRHAIANSQSSDPDIQWFYCSANPELEALYHNPWRSPEVQYPGFIALARTFLRASRLGDLMLDAMVHSRLFATGNLIVARPDRWRHYISFVEEALEEARKNLDANTRRQLFEEIPRLGKLTMLGLIVARLPGLYLSKYQHDMRHMKVPLPNQEQALNAHLRILRDLKDRALEQSDQQLARSWSAYRGLYLAHVYGREWVLKHINSITPANRLS